MSLDYSIVAEDDSGTAMTAHVPTCPEVAKARAADRPIMTMLDCETPLPPDDPVVRLHECCHG